MNLNLENLPRTIWVEKSGGVPAVGFVDQRLLPGELILVRTSDWREVVDAVKTLAVRGAPAIGVAGAAAVMLAAYEYAAVEGDARLAAQRDCEESIGSTGEIDRATFDHRLEEAAGVIAEARPTAVHLSWGVRRAQEAARAARAAGKTAAETAEALYELAEALIAEDEAAMLLCAMVLPRGSRVSTSSRTAMPAVWRRRFMARLSASFMRLHKKGSSTVCSPTRRGP